MTPNKKNAVIRLDASPIIKKKYWSVREVLNHETDKKDPNSNPYIFIKKESCNSGKKT